MRVFIRDDHLALSVFTAQHIATAINAHAALLQSRPESAPKHFNIAFPCGAAVNKTYSLLVDMCQRKEVSFINVKAFVIDEYIDKLEPESPKRQSNIMEELFYSQVDIKKQNIHYLDPFLFVVDSANSYDSICENFEALIQSCGGLDLAWFGVGMDGHIARNEPGSSFSSRSRVMGLAFDTRSTLATRWGCDVSEVPEMALTAGVATLFDSRDVLVLFTGPSRAQTLSHSVEGAMNHMIPASVFQSHSHSTFVCDEPATYELRVKTVEYFRGIERTSREVFGVEIHGGGGGGGGKGLKDT
jgi:glucosamine-6-phosphate deaminase